MTWVTGQKLYSDKYEIQQELGRGRFAITYLAKNQDGKSVVIKTLNPDILNQLTDTERDRLESGFADESRKLEKCKHPHVVGVIETFKHGQLQCTVMEYIQGDNLAKLVSSRGFFPEKEALVYIQQIGQALTVVHQQEFLHRDIKPENIMVRAGNYQAVLIDFDLARGFDHPLTSRGARVDGFTALELYSDSTRQQQRRGAWTDIYSLAATLYVLLTGKQPTSAIDRKDQDQRLIPPKELNQNISDRVNQAILHGMELEPEKRPQTVQSWLDKLGVKQGSWLKLPWKQPLWAVIFEVMAFLALIAALVSGIKDGKDLFFPEKPPTQENPSIPSTPQSR